LEWRVEDVSQNLLEEQAQLNDLLSSRDEMFDLIRRMYAALETRNWLHDYLYE
jgi:hypothetical protein|tara:strand:- start:838 stop:996 length:159 start_codon:yes stop_codon:yes gene_type:complete